MFLFAAVMYSLAVGLIANSYVLVRQMPQLLFLLIPFFLFTHLFAGCMILKTHSKTLRVCCHGTILLICFYASVILSTVLQLVLAVRTVPHDYMQLIWSLVYCFGSLFLVFWNGILCVYLTSAQLGFKIRVMGILCGMIPIANLIVLFVIIQTTARECLMESHKETVNRQRADQRICATKYPILLVHGVFFRDTKYFNYWGRIPKELEANGATVFYGNHRSAASVEDSAEEIKKRVLEILTETEAEKVNIIAHSKGGLDCRYAIARLGLSRLVASLTTVNTPHKGCLFADYLLGQIPSNIQEQVAHTYNSTLKKFGETDADFLAAVKDLTDSRCRQRDAELPAPDGVFCQSIGSVLTKATNGAFPLNLSYRLAKHFGGDNDGLVVEDSFRWGENYMLLRPTGKQGISHGDMIDLYRKNLHGFDVREFYVQLVGSLKAKGM